MLFHASSGPSLFVFLIFFPVIAGVLLSCNTRLWNRFVASLINTRICMSIQGTNKILQESKWLCFAGFILLCFARPPTHFCLLFAVFTFRIGWCLEVFGIGSDQRVELENRHFKTASGDSLLCDFVEIRSVSNPFLFAIFPFQDWLVRGSVRYQIGGTGWGNGALEEGEWKY